MKAAKLTIFTIGHSTRSTADFITILKSFSIQQLVDIRSIPKSRYNPQFMQETLAKNLAKADIGYIYLKELGGLRHTAQDSPNLGWRNASFRGYADYMQTEAFLMAIAELVKVASLKPTAIMCAEAVPWRCHRSLVGDALLARAIEAVDIMGEHKSQPHRLTKFAKLDGQKITYPPETS